MKVSGFLEQSHFCKDTEAATAIAVQQNLSHLRLFPE